MKLLAFSRSFADINVPVQPFEVALPRHVEPPAEKPQLSIRWQLPENWDALRGAAATAAFAVPAIDPWVKLLCQWLRDGVAHPELTDRLRVPWLRAAPWTEAEEVRNSLPGLWRAAVEVFSAPGRLREWRPKNVLSAICDRAMSLDHDLQFEERLDVERFQDWLATASITSKLPKIAPVGGLPKEPRADLQLPIGDAEGRNLTDASHKKAASVDKPKRASGTRVVETPPAGLEMFEDFISASQELELVEAIDSGDWSTELRRRVQHYGWRYDYKARGIAQKDYLGPLPSWAEELAQKLFEEGLFPRMSVEFMTWVLSRHHA